MNPSENNSENYINIPESYSRRKLNALYREIPLKDTTFRTLRKYFNAMVHLYGIITLQKAYEIISGQNPGLVTEEEFYAFAEIARHEIEDYTILGAEDLYTDAKPSTPPERELIDCSYFLTEEDPYLEVKELQYGKPYYIPPKKELLRYADVFYIEETPELIAMEEFLFRNLPLREEERETLRSFYLDSQDGLDISIDLISDYIDDCGYKFKSENDVQTFINLYTDFINNSRLQCNCGHTPKEIFDENRRNNVKAETVSLDPQIRTAIENGEIDTEKLCESVRAMNLPNEEIRNRLLKEIAVAKTAALRKEMLPKVGRNDPCPCGSGKKYKKCCGK